MIENPEEMGERPPLPLPMSITEMDRQWKELVRSMKPCRSCGQDTYWVFCRDCMNDRGEK